MNFRQFLIQLSAVTGGLLLVLFAINFLLHFPTLDGVTIGAVVFFLVLCVFVFLWAKRAVADPNPLVFTRMALASIGMKMFLVVLLVAVYVKVAQPQSKFALIPALGVYFVYAAFETYFLMRLGKEVPK